MHLLTWLANGLLAALYTGAEHLGALLACASAALLARALPAEYRPWGIGTGALAFLACLLAPAPVPAMMAALQLGGWAALGLEQFDPRGRMWQLVAGQGLYAAAGLASILLREVLRADPANPASSQGMAYLDLGLTLSLYLIPAGYLWLALQSLLAHPPAPGAPGRMIQAIRTRGKD